MQYVINMLLAFASLVRLIQRIPVALVGSQLYSFWILPGGSLGYYTHVNGSTGHIFKVGGL